jgi:hypothetical protein
MKTATIAKNTHHYQERKPEKAPQHRKTLPQNQQERMENNTPP